MNNSAGLFFVHPKSRGRKKRLVSQPRVGKKSIKRTKKQDVAGEISVKEPGPPTLSGRINQELYRRNAELAVRNKTLALLRQLDEISLQTLEIEEMASRMTNAIAIALGYDLVSIVTIRAKGKKMHWAGVSSAIPWVRSVVDASHLCHFEEAYGDSVLSKILNQKKNLMYVNDPIDVYPADFVRALVAADRSPEVEEIKYSMVYALKFDKKVLGALVLSSSRPLKQISSYEQEEVSGITGLAALALYKTEIYEDLQRTSDELTKANTKLRDLDKTKSEFLSIASHQLYTPLTALRGYLSMLQEGDFGTIPAKQEAVLNILNQSAIRLIELIKGLLDISRIESGRLELNLESVDIVEMLQQMVQDLMPNAMKKQLKLFFTKPQQAMPHVVLDRERIRQVMLNFIDNAIKYTDKGQIEVQVKQVDDAIIFSVVDTGKGITPEDLERLFTKFTRVGGAARYHTEGSGLGLYVAKQIVTEHHGDVFAESGGLNQGSTFSVKLPVEKSPGSLKVGQHLTVAIKAAESSDNKE